jgi:hypothetical protein
MKIAYNTIRQHIIDAKLKKYVSSISERAKNILELVQ